ncbi:helix-turn-helix transcriptional regulator [Lentilactobacillus sp. SPB1-3]|uniref:Helix-turn-helix transcriptional regulator n=1 Tax=Lentilactobacillus terminaliae TaxID=3003483 RepID=A0ACD5DE30_9LACO|nr:helix-turn-helix transcriptional regulator [Lentilactobacillus sp. SPB1-3]MCZ0977697.1 helix-turn-helix transcriptional regulator [Lentilactobacillus sp. SPB1-3]
MNFSDKLKKCRNQKGITQEELADYLHVSRKTVSGWETGRSYPDVNIIINISDFFDVSFENLIRDDQVLSYYADQDKQLVKNKRLQKVLYVLNIILLFCDYLHMFYIK